MTERFTPFSGGKCESGQAHRYSIARGYCLKRARWQDNQTGVLLCGEHKRERESSPTESGDEQE